MKRTRGSLLLFPDFFLIPGLGALIVEFLDLGQWSHWLWHWDETYDTVNLQHALQMRPQMTHYMMNRCFAKDNFALFQRIVGHDRLDVMEIRHPGDLVRDLIFRSKDIAFFLFSRVSPTIKYRAFDAVCCTGIAIQTNEIEWRVQMLLSTLNDDKVTIGFQNACVTNNLDIAKHIWNSGRVKDHRFMFEVLNFATPKHVLHFLLGLGYCTEDVQTLRVNFRDATTLHRMNDPSLFTVLAKISVIQPKDAQYFFELGFACDNVCCMQYFAPRIATLQYPMSLDIKHSIRCSESIDYLLQHCKISLQQANQIVHNMDPTIFVRAQDILKHVLKTCVTRNQVRSFLLTVTQTAWKKRNVPLLYWLWDNQKEHRHTSFVSCFHKVQHILNAEMLEFYLEHCPPAIVPYYHDELLNLTLQHPDTLMFRVLLRYELVSQHDFFTGRWQTSLMSVCLKNIDFLKLVWEPTTEWTNDMHQTLLRYAIQNENEDLMLFLWSKHTHISIYYRHDLAFFVRCGLDSLIQTFSNTDFQMSNFESFEVLVYSNLSQKNTMATLHAIWQVLPASRKTLLTNNCDIFWRICQLNIHAGVYLWHKQLLTSQEIFANERVADIKHEFAAAIDFDF